MLRIVLSHKRSHPARRAAALAGCVSVAAVILGWSQAFAAMGDPGAAASGPAQPLSSYGGWKDDPPAGAGPMAASGDPERGLGASALPYGGWQAAEPGSASEGQSAGSVTPIRRRRPR